MAQKKKSWFGAKGLFRHMDPDSPSIQDRYEESIVVLKAESEEQAEQRALEKFRKYAREELGIFFTGHYEICHLFDPVRAGREVYWFMRISRLTPEKYVEKYWDDGRPRSCADKGWTHFWHNLDGKRSGCLNCQEVRRGKLWKHRKAKAPKDGARTRR
jgi:hypothetical protein